MELTVVLILLALLQYCFFVGYVGYARGKYGVNAPHTTGNEVWERIFRVQQNTLEQLIVFVPAMVIFGMYVSDVWVAIPGIAFILGRQIYFHTYINDPKTRGPGATLSIFSNIGLVVASLIALLISFIG